MRLILFLSLITFNASAIDAMTSYQTTNIKNEAHLYSLFDKLYRHKKSVSQCYDRAMTWSYQLYREDNVFTQKYFIYFTAKYRREIWSKWWFHVAPGVLFQNEPYVFDPEFLKKPVSLEAWKNGAIDHAIKLLTPLKIKYEKEIAGLQNQNSALNPHDGKQAKLIQKNNNRIQWLENELKRRLIADKRIIKADQNNWPFNDKREELIDIDCPIITDYSQYKNVQETEYCFIQLAPMYVWEPSELEKMENQSENKVNFINSEVFSAYKRAFKGNFPYRFEN
jgi:hypothetical protein